MQKQKTISGHYDTAYNLAHNNRQFLPRNVDVERVCWNFYCVAAGQEAGMDWKEPHHISEFWRTYRELNSRYWSERSLARLEAERECREKMERTIQPPIISHPPQLCRGVGNDALAAPVDPLWNLSEL